MWGVTQGDPMSPIICYNVVDVVLSLTEVFNYRVATYWIWYIVGKWGVIVYVYGGRVEVEDTEWVQDILRFWRLCSKLLCYKTMVLKLRP